MRGALLAIAVLASSVGVPQADATGLDDLVRSVGVPPAHWYSVHGALRVRGALLHNLDMDHGLTPSGAPLFPTPLTDPDGQALMAADMRLRTDLGVQTPGGGLALQVRVDVLDNLRLGGAPEGHPTATGTQRPAEAAFRIKRAYGAALTPFGYVAAGRMGHHWGLGMVAHSGDCDDCDSSDAVDRVAFLTSLVGHLWAVAFDLSSTGTDLDPGDDVYSITAAMLRVHSDDARRRRLRADRAAVEYGAFVSHRWQTNDVLAHDVVVARGFTATAVDAFFRYTGPTVRVAAEAAVLVARIEQATLIPGALLRDPIDAFQYGLAVETDFGPWDGALRGGLDAGLASGDSAPGFGARAEADDPLPTAGDLDGPQVRPAADVRVDNFRFHSDYRIDRLLFREVIGAVTDAVYLRPHLDWRVAAVGPGALTLQVAGVVSWAVEPNSTPGGVRPLGIELDPTLAWSSRDGFGAALDYAVLFPLAGFDNRATGRSARPAQLVRLRLRYSF